MSSVDFPMPDVLHFDRTCGGCGTRWTVECAFGADEPQREPYYRCPDCRAPLPELTADRFGQLTAGRAQLALVKDDDVE